MPIAAYAAECAGLIDELIQSTSADDVLLMREGLAGTTDDGWLQWRIQTHQTICEFVASAPSKRKRRKSWNQPESGHLIRLAAIQHLICGYHFLNTIDANQLYPGPSYRDMAAMAGAAYMYLYLSCDENHWPFDSPAPFDWKLYP